MGVATFVDELRAAVKSLGAPFLALPEDGHTTETLAYRRGAHDAYAQVIAVLEATGSEAGRETMSVDRITITSLYGMHSQRGLVQIDMGSETAQLDIDDAINHARRILEAANAAATDATLARFLREKLDQPPEVVAAVLQDFRRWRLAEEPE